MSYISAAYDDSRGFEAAIIFFAPNGKKREQKFFIFKENMCATLVLMLLGERGEREFEMRGWHDHLSLYTAKELIHTIFFLAKTSKELD